MSNANLRRHLARTCKKHGLLVQPNAINELLQEMTKTDPDDFADLLILLQVKLARSKPKLITRVVLQQVLEEGRQRSARQQEADKQEEATDVEMSIADREDSTMEEEDSSQQRPLQNQQMSKTKATTKANTSIKDRKAAPPDSSSSSSSSSIAVPRSSWRVLSAFVNTPKLTFDSMRQQFSYGSNVVIHKDGSVKPAPLMGTVADKLDMMTQRYKLVQQRVMRHRQREHLSYLTTIDRLLGHSNDADHGQPVVLLGLLKSSQDSAMTGCYLELEDLTGTVPLRLGWDEDFKTEIDPDSMYLDGSIVLVHGNHDNGILDCFRIEMPPLEAPSVTGPHLPPSPYTGFSKSNNTCNGFDHQHAPIKIRSLANVALDDPVGVSRLEGMIKMLERIDSEDSTSFPGETILVLFGNFAADFSSLSTALDELARLLQGLPPRHSVLLLPGPMDVSSSSAGAVCWPLPALSLRSCPALHQMPNVHLCTNPCRLEFPGGRHIMLARKDLIRESLQQQILTPPVHNEGDSKGNGIFSNRPPAPLVERVLRYTVCQGHLMPQSPVYWNYDHAMHLYPLPDVALFGLDADFDDGGGLVFHPLDEKKDEEENPPEYETNEEREDWEWRGKDNQGRKERHKSETKVVVPGLNGDVLITVPHLGRIQVKVDKMKEKAVVGDKKGKLDVGNK